MPKNSDNTKLTIGFITYGKSTSKYLPYFLDSLFKQSYSDFSLVAVDCTDDGDKSNLEILKKYPQINIIQEGKNLGFAKSYNLMINKAARNGAEFFLAINPDMILDKRAIEKMLDAFAKDERLASVAPKIYKWNFKDGSSGLDDEKTNVIDSFGIKLKSGLRFFDIGQGQFDQGQFDKSKILGPSGAAAMYRVKALEKVKFNNQYFDELMFMYKEDCDLAYRLSLAGYRSKLAVNAKIYHDRTAKAIGESKLLIALNRKNKSRQIKKWSLLYQLIIVKKFWKLQSFVNKFVIIWHILLIFIFSLIFEQYLLKEFFKVFRIKVASATCRE
ncbi:glycosyltransferase family 2 protein [Candidatus Parcubacteria bacterium]|nr:glycosyltransferase family 2 protein [Candidatus Parcubacteria bacterium]